MEEHSNLDSKAAPEKTLTSSDGEASAPEAQSYRIERIVGTDKIEECWDLLEEHRKELATHQHLMVLNPDINRYLDLEENGCLLSLAVYKGEEIVGYSVTILAYALHYADLTMASNDVLYLRKDLRKGAWGVRLIKETEKYAKERGAKLMLWHGKENTAFCELMPRLGYRIQDIMFSKEL